MVDAPLSGVSRPKYHDFKVYMSKGHYNNGNSLSPSLHNVNQNDTTLVIDEWVYSQFVSADDDQDGSADADEFTVHMLGNHEGTSDNWSSVGLIQSYAESRITVPYMDLTQPNVESNDPLLNVFDMSSEEQMNDLVDNLINDNDRPPYDVNFYVGQGNDHMQHVARVGTETGVGRVGRASGFCAPFGLICVDPHGLSTAFRVVLNLAVGTYHGVYAERA